MSDHEEFGRIISGAPENDLEGDLETSIRPLSLADFNGQPKAREQLEIFISAAKQRKEALDHVLVFGPPGLGKTTLAHIIANELGSQLKQTSGPVIERAGDLAAMLTNLEPYDVLFVDEIHRMNPAIEEILYPAMEDRQLDIHIGEGVAARTMQIPLPPFTLVGATTRAGLLTSPLRDRFGIVMRLEFYSSDDLAGIIKRTAGIFEIECDNEGLKAIARRSRGTPRIANRLLRRVRDYAQVKGDGIITSRIANQAMDMLEVDQYGLDLLDRNVLIALADKFDGGPVGLDSLAVAVGEERGTIEEVIEPYLIQQGFLMRTPRGRMATRRTWEILGMTPPKNNITPQDHLFDPLFNKNSD